MRQRYLNKKLGRDALTHIAHADKIIGSYQQQGYKLTLRQLYYQFVSQNLITNEEKSYKKLAETISNGRLAGLLDWDGIEDRGREPVVPLQFDSLKHRVDSALRNYRLPRWEGQESYCELWVEKQALAGVLAPLAHEFHVTMMVNKGYSSQSAMYDSAQRFREGMGTEGDIEMGYNDDGDEVISDFPWANLESEREGYLFYLGDHDPSGEDMVRDIRERMAMFGVHELNVIKIALTMPQIQQFKPPPNPAKINDPRAKEYIAQHGNSSWEVDALPPNVLVRLIRAAFKAVIDRPVMDTVIAPRRRGQSRPARSHPEDFNGGVMVLVRVYTRSPGRNDFVDCRYSRVPCVGEKVHVGGVPWKVIAVLLYDRPRLMDNDGQNVAQIEVDPT